MLQYDKIMIVVNKKKTDNVDRKKMKLICGSL